MGWHRTPSGVYLYTQYRHLHCITHSFFILLLLASTARHRPLSADAPALAPNARWRRFRHHHPSTTSKDVHDNCFIIRYKRKGNEYKVSEAEGYMELD